MHDGNFILLAVKTESTDSLDIETKVLMRMRKAVHFCPLFDEGYDSFSEKKFIVMGLVGAILSNLRRQFGRFSLSTVIRVGMQVSIVLIIYLYCLKLDLLQQYVNMFRLYIFSRLYTPLKNFITLVIFLVTSNLLISLWDIQMQ